MFNYEEYKNLPPIQTPYRSEKLKFTITRICGQCFKCKRDVTDVRGTVVEHGECIEARYAGACHYCNGLTNFQVRWYPKEKRMTALGDDGWGEYTLSHHGIFAKIVEFFKRFF